MLAKLRKQVRKLARSTNRKESPEDKMQRRKRLQVGRAGQAEGFIIAPHFCHRAPLTSCVYLPDLPCPPAASFFSAFYPQGIPFYL